MVRLLVATFARIFFLKPQIPFTNKGLAMLEMLMVLRKRGKESKEVEKVLEFLMSVALVRLIGTSEEDHSSIVASFF
jgi:hypothetical protein